MGAVLSGLELLYDTAPGRLLLRLLTRPGLSRAAGRFLASPLSRARIAPFVRRNGIDLSQYGGAPYASFNAFFTRPVLPGKRPFDRDPAALCSPCDARLTVYELSHTACFTVKNVSYTLPRLLRDDALAASFAGGLALVFRLCVDDYHRYCWFDGGVPGAQTRIPGVLHTVRPVAVERVPVFCENSRAYATLASDSFGPAVQMEVGAMMVGKIRNAPLPARVGRGDEKGFFEFGGSTVIVLLQKDRADLRGDILAASARGAETRVLQGERVGTAR